MLPFHLIYQDRLGSAQSTKPLTPPHQCPFVLSRVIEKGGKEVGRQARNYGMYVRSRKLMIHSSYPAGMTDPLQLLAHTSSLFQLNQVGK